MNWEILSKYIKDECSKKELAQLQKWLNEHPGNEDFFQSFVELSKYEPEMDVDDVQHAWENLKKNHLNNKKFIPCIYEHDCMPSKSWWAASEQKWAVLSSVAVVVLLLTAAGVFQMKRKGYFTTENTPAKITYRTITTKKGQRTKLHLKDGTKITLNAASKLRVPENYGLSKRVVYLKGEAFFKVTHNEAMPFTVHSGDVIVQDVGTAFNILAYDSTRISIAVKEGAVSVGKIPEKKTEPVRFFGKLTKNKVGRINANEDFSVSTIHNIDVFTSWMKGKFVFRNTPLPQVVKRLGRRFNVKSKIVGSALKKRTLTATYEHLSLDQILDVMSVSLHIAYSYHDSTIVFKSKR